MPYFFIYGHFSLKEDPRVWNVRFLMFYFSLATLVVTIIKWNIFYEFTALIHDCLEPKSEAPCFQSGRPERRLSPCFALKYFNKKKAYRALNAFQVPAGT